MEIFNNIPSSSTVLCLDCSIKTIELIKINVKLSNIDFECNDKYYNYIIIGKNQLLEDEFFSNIKFNEQLELILEKSIHTLTQHYIEFTMLSKYGFKIKKNNTEDYLYIEFKRDKMGILYLKSKSNNNINLCENNIKTYSKHLHYDLTILYSKDYKNTHNRLFESIKYIKDYKYLLLIYNYSIFSDININIENAISFISFSKNMTLYLDKSYSFYNFILKNTEYTLDLISEITCIIYKSDLLNNYIKEQANKTISINYFKNYFNCEKKLMDKTGVFEFILTLNNNEYETVNYTKNDYLFNSLVLHYAFIYKFSYDKYSSIIFKKYAWGNILDGVIGYIRFNFGNKIEGSNELKGTYTEITDQIYKIVINNNIYFFTFYNDYKEFTGFREHDNYKVIGFILDI